MLAVLIQNLHIFFLSLLNILLIFLVFSLQMGTPQYAYVIPSFMKILRIFIFFRIVAEEAKSSLLCSFPFFMVMSFCNFHFSTLNQYVCWVLKFYT